MYHHKTFETPTPCVDRFRRRVISPPPKGIRAKVHVPSVFGPFARNDEYGSRKFNLMELYQNQVTRVHFILKMLQHGLLNEKKQ